MEMSGCLKHARVVIQLLRETRENGRNLTVLWLDLANAHSYSPHKLVQHALLKHCVLKHQRLQLYLLWQLQDEGLIRRYNTRLAQCQLGDNEWLHHLSHTFLPSQFLRCSRKEGGWIHSGSTLQSPPSGQIGAAGKVPSLYIISHIIYRIHKAYISTCNPTKYPVVFPWSMK